MNSPLEELRAALADRYEIEREIGSGGMATVYLARDIRHKREVALKVLRPELGAVLGTERFLSEITVTANLQHPNLLPLFDSGEVNGLLFYVMPFVRGETLRSKIDREKQLAVDEAVRITVALCGALQCAHENGVIHRDLKPENILLQSGQPVIADFGIALAVSKAGGSRVTQTGLSLGTPQYMSPEQATGDRVIDARTDIYSLGAVTYEMLSGEPPHSGSTAQAVIAKLMTTEPQPLNTLRSTIPNNVVCAVEKALEKLPADRFSTAQEFASALQNPSFTIARKGYAPLQDSAALNKWKRIAAGASAAALLLLGVGLWSLLKPPPAKPVTRYILGLDSTHALAGGIARVALSRDGRRLVYSVGAAAVGNQFGSGPYLVLRERNQLEGKLLSGVDQANSPFFSWDGSKIGYTSPPGLLKVLSLSGGGAVEIADSVLAGGAVFGPDGSIFITAQKGRGINRIADSPGAPLVPVTRVDSAAGEIQHNWPDISPDGKMMVFTIIYRGGPQAKPSAIAITDVSSGKYTIVAAGVRAKFARNGYLLYVTPEGTLMAARLDAKARKVTSNPVAVAQGLRVGAATRPADFAITDAGTLMYVGGSAGGDREAVWVGRDGKMQSIDSTWRGQLLTPALSPDGKRLAVSINDGTNSHIWIKQLDRGPALKLTFEGSGNIYPTWTPDGKSITYAGNASGSEDLWTKRADGSAQAVLQLHEKNSLAVGRWSRDGKWLVVRRSVNADGGGDILAMRPGVDSVATPLIATSFTEVSPALSPDGRYLAYSSTETGRHEVYVVPFPNVSSAKWPISTAGGQQPLWSHSGRELFYRGENNLISVPVTLSPTFSAGPARKLFISTGFQSGANQQQYDIAPDDSRFVFLRLIGAQVANNIYFVENWFEEMKKK